MNRFFASIAALTLTTITAVGCAGTTEDDELTGTSEEELSSNIRVRCSSNDHAFRRCDVDGRIVSARVRRQLSDARCEEGSSWGWRRDHIWVDRGCRADFDVRVRGGSGGSSGGERIQCNSNDHRYTFCESEYDRVFDVRLIRQDSDARCTEGESFGAAGNGIWVDRGCRGLFQVRGH
jgi:hypothetical protein